MSYKARAFRIDDIGERATLIVDGFCVPVDLPSRFLLRQRESRLVSLSGMKQAMDYFS